MILRERCQAITQRHTQCLHPALANGRFCATHERLINGN